MALVAVAEVWASYALLETLTVFLLTMRFSAIASLKVTLFSCITGSFLAYMRAHLDAAVAGLDVRHHLVLGFGPCWDGHELCLPECLRVAHENVLLGLNPDRIKFAQVVAAHACTSCATVAIVSKAFTVKFQALRLSAIARLMSGRLRCVVGSWNILLWHLMAHLLLLGRVMRVMWIRLNDLLMLSSIMSIDMATWD